MNETEAIIRAFDEAHGQNCAMATVVGVEGSAYRRPGARMLVGEHGAGVGAISAGCLENDVIAHAQRAIASRAVKLVEYDISSSNGEMAWGLGLGCNGVVRVLIEPLAPASSYVTHCAVRSPRRRTASSRPSFIRNRRAGRPRVSARVYASTHSETFNPASTMPNWRRRSNAMRVRCVAMKLPACASTKPRAA